MATKTRDEEIAALKEQLERLQAQRLACGGKGPCCHVGYSHRHCEHCDTVIATSITYPTWWWQQPAYTWDTGSGSLNVDTNGKNYLTVSGISALTTDHHCADGEAAA